MFLLWFHQDAMAASMSAGTLHWALICFPLGLAQYANTFVAQYYGSGQLHRIGPVIWQSVRVGIYAIPLFALSGALIPLLFRAFGHPVSIMELETTYFRVLLLAAPAAVMNGALSSFYTGRGQTRIVMYVNALSTIVNILFDYLWVFGKAGFPVMGIVGAGLATVLANWVQTIVYFILMHTRDNPQRYHLFQRQLDRQLLWRMIYYGSPNGLQYLVESSTFSIVMLKLARLGSHEMAATTMAFNVNAIAFIPLVGISIAVSTLVAQQLMHQRADLAVRATWNGVLWAFVYSIGFGIGYLFYPDLLTAGYAAGSNSGTMNELRATTVILFRFAAAYCLFDAMQIVFVGAIKGAGDTWFVLVSSMVVAMTAVFIGVIGEHFFHGGLYWWWSVITGWICVLGLLFCARFLQGHWKTMRVIEIVPAE
jgi:MATE family multidrug resistance protein